jgi:uncharacterized membrane protein
MSRGLGIVLRVAAAGLVMALPPVTHLVLIASVPSPAAYGLLLCQAIFAACFIAAQVRPPYRPYALLAWALCCVPVGFISIAHGLVLSSALTHAFAYAMLLSLFGTSLLPGREPLVSFFARQIHGPLSAEIRRYTRNVTWLWCIFCLAQLLGSLLLILFAPVAWWSIFVNVLNLPLVLTLFVGEAVTRPLWVADPPRERLADVLRMVNMVRGGRAERYSDLS